MKTTYKLVLSLGVIFALGLTSCLKDDMVESQKYGMINLNAKKIVEIPSSSTRSESIALPIVTDPTAVNTTVHLAAEEVAAEDVKVTMSIAESATMLAAYNTANSTSYTLLPSSLYTLPNGLDVTIAKGTKDANFTMNVKTTDFNPALVYAIFVKVTAVDKAAYTISGNFNYKLLTIAVKNKYDGVYSYEGQMSGNFTGWLYSPDAFVWPGDVGLATLGANKVAILDRYYTWSSGQRKLPALFGSGYGFNAYGGNEPGLTFDLSTNAITAVTNDATAPATIYTLDPTYTNKYDPATKTIDVRFNLTRPANDRGALKMTLKLVYKKVR
jgi:hypothetical protein